MSERKVLNKYYPPDFDPSKIPRMKLARNRQYTVRLMAPFNMRCKTCGEYIYKGKKFNARKEDVEGDDYLGIRIYRFYIKCTRCLQEISFKTDPKNTDYEIEAGATRNFMALKLAEEQAQREEDEKKEEEATNPMKLLEKRTQQSKQELELLESLEELKDLNRRQQIIDYDQMLKQFDTEAIRRKKEKEQEELDEQYVQSIFSKKLGSKVVEEEVVELQDNEYSEPQKKMLKKETSVTEGSSLSAKGGSVKVKDSEKQKDHAPMASTSGISLWHGNLDLAPIKTSITSLVKKKNSLGIKLNSSSIRIKAPTLDAAADKSDAQTIESAKTKETTIDVSSISTDTKTVKVISAKNEMAGGSNGLSLLGTYSGSSDNDSDRDL